MFWHIVHACIVYIMLRARAHFQPYSWAQNSFLATAKPKPQQQPTIILFGTDSVANSAKKKRHTEIYRYEAAHGMRGSAMYRARYISLWPLAMTICSGSRKSKKQLHSYLTHRVTCIAHKSGGGGKKWCCVHIHQCPFGD